ncbi:MAG TPA: hypothetical protein VML56_15250 [Burkholderiales bacterium]|nr:hypothetical protein [Burkholderiales bacterium]
MFKRMLVVSALVLAPLGASAYEIGNLTCENIGQLAGQTLLAKQSGVPIETYLSALNDRIPGDAYVERQIIASITVIIYENDLLTGMKPADAYAVFQQDCARGQAEDRVIRQQEDSGATDEDGSQGTAKG